MQSTLGIRLLDVEPDIGRFLSDDERAEARRLVVPTHVIAVGNLDTSALLDQAPVFGALLLDGMVLQRIRVGEQVGLRFLGPGDMLSLAQESRSTLLSYSDCRAVAETRVALLGQELLTAVQRWPRLLAGLHLRFAEQADRLSAQLVISQLPRVEDRLMAILWLLAETWGHVTPAGTALPISMTHDVLGGLVGARRSTVTLALGELADRGALIRQGRSWMLLEPPPSGPHELPDFEDPGLLHDSGSSWKLPATHRRLPGSDVQELFDTVERLREQHVINQRQVRDQLQRATRTRKRRAEGGRILQKPAITRRVPS